MCSNPILGPQQFLAFFFLLFLLFLCGYKFLPSTPANNRTGITGGNTPGLELLSLT